MESITKNKPSMETIRKMAKKAFGDAGCSDICELTEGFFNAAYLVTLSDGREVILKIAPPPETLLMTYEKDIMTAEAACMRLVKEKTQIPVPAVLFFDDSRTICKSTYFFMEKLEGQSLNQLSDQLSPEIRETIDSNAGRFNREINAIIGSKFGYFSQSKKQGDNWFTVFSSMMDDVFHDAETLKIDFGADPDAIRALLARDKVCFDEVTVARLVHWDLWAGNIFVKEGKITGLIDFERCLWADVLMEVGFRSFGQNQAFLRGYGAQQPTENEQHRIRWYDLYLFLINSLETDYRKYPDRGMFDWAKVRIQETLGWLTDHPEK